MVRIENWSVVCDECQNIYLPPEHLPRRLHGNVFGHPRHEDGKSVTTSPIASASGRLVTTHSGTLYELGTTSDDYEKYCVSLGKPIDTVEPIKVKK